MSTASTWTWTQYIVLKPYYPLFVFLLLNLKDAYLWFNCVLTAKGSTIAEPDGYVVEAYGLRVGKDPSLLNVCSK